MERHVAEIGDRGRKGSLMAAFSEEVRGDEIQRINQKKSVVKGESVNKCEW